MYKLGINFDEISDDLAVALQVMEQCDVKYGELRTINQKNFVFWSDEEVADFKQQVDAAGIELVAAATPLFKWYEHAGDKDIPHDSFGFNPRLDDGEKKKIIERACIVASHLGIPRLRIFSGLGRVEDAGAMFASDPLLSFALELAEKHKIDLYLENEPVCRVHSKQEIVSLLTSQPSPRLKLWLDIANLVELGEDIDKVFLAEVSSRLGYIHIKDFVMTAGQKTYVPTGDGRIKYSEILGAINDLGIKDLVFTVETHAQSDKIGASIKSLAATTALLKALTPKIVNTTD